MDGDVAPLAELAELAQRHGCRLMVDEAHATGCVGPGGRGSVAAAGLSERGRRDHRARSARRSASYGAYVCGSAELTDYLVNTARPFIFSTAPAPAGRSPPPRRRSAAAATGPSGSSACARTPPRCARRCAREGLDVGGRRDARSSRWWSARPSAAMALCERALERGVFAQAIRPPTVPAGTSRLRLTVMATHRVGDLREAARVIGAAARELGVADGGRRRAAATGAARMAATAPSSGLRRRRPCAGRLRHRHRDRGRQDRRRRRDRAHARRATGRRVAVFKPAVTGLDELAARGRGQREPRPRAAAPRGRLRPDRRRDRAVPLRARRLPAPGGRAGRRADRPGAAARGAPARPPRDADLLVCEGVGGFLVPLTGRLPGPRPRPDLGLPLVIAASPGLGTINHTLLDASRRCARPGSRCARWC